MNTKKNTLIAGLALLAGGISLPMLAAADPGPKPPSHWINVHVHNDSDNTVSVKYVVKYTFQSLICSVGPLGGGDVQEEVWPDGLSIPSHHQADGVNEGPRLGWYLLQDKWCNPTLVEIKVQCRDGRYLQHPFHVPNSNTVDAKIQNPDIHGCPTVTP